MKWAPSTTPLMASSISARRGSSGVLGSNRGTAMKRARLGGVRESTLDPRRLSDIAARYGLVLHGQDREVVALGPLSSGSAHRSALLTFVTAPSWLEVFASGDLAAAIVHEGLVGQVPDGKALLATSGDPEEVFYALLADTVEAGEWQGLRSSVGEGTVIA